jgi:hypothetical protein
MKASAQARHPLERQVIRFETIARLRSTVENGYGRVREIANRKWQTLFAGQSDPSDACVTVRIRTSDAEKRPYSSVAILQAGKNTIPKTKRKLAPPRFPT